MEAWPPVFTEDKVQHQIHRHREGFKAVGGTKLGRISAYVFPSPVIFQTLALHLPCA